MNQVDSVLLPNNSQSYPQLQWISSGAYKVAYLV